MSSPKISIIVPVYKVEKYLSQCLDSIFKQTFTDWECILVDDGSPDGCGGICDEYAIKDNRFKVIHKGNEGVSVARNCGLEKATGEWIAFVDSDDFVEENWLEQVICECVDSKTLIGYGYKRINPNGSVSMKINSFESTIDSLNLNNGIPHMVWAFLFNRQVIDTNVISFPKGIKYSEDQYFIYRYMACVENVRIIAKTLYNYVLREGSAVSIVNKDRFLCNLKIAEILSSEVNGNGKAKKFSEKASRYMLRYFLTYGCRSKIKNELTPLYKDYYEKILNKNRNVVNRVDLAISRYCYFLSPYRCPWTSKIVHAYAKINSNF